MKEQEKTIIQLSEIKKCYDKDIAVVEDFNLEVKKGEFITFLGPSGCGKTTILRMIGGFETPTEGSILLDGKDITKLPPNHRPINTVFQKYALFPYLNIYDNIAFGLKLKKMSKKQIDEKVKKVLEVVDLEGFEKRNVATLSGGQQQRIAIARAIVNEPEILLLDEPLGALDYKMRKEMQLELKQMHEELGLTFIMVTHDQEEALTMSDKIVVISDGKIQQVGTPEEIYNTPANAFVADFIGESNIFDGIVTGEYKVRFCGAEFVCEDEYPIGTRIESVVRPEDVILMEPGKGKLDGSVISSIFKGTYYEITIQSDNYEIVAQSQKAIEKDTSVGMDILPDGMHIMAYDVSCNHFTGRFDSDMVLHIGENTRMPDVTRIFAGSSLEDGVLYDKDGQVMNLEGVLVDAYIDPKDAKLSDNLSEGDVQGHIVSIIYKGDHYKYTVRTENEVDYFVDDEWLWNNGDNVSVIIPENKVIYHVKKEK